MSMQTDSGATHPMLSYTDKLAPQWADFLLLAGTGCANAPETIELSRAALADGYDAVLLLALLAASGPATPSIAPLPNSSFALPRASRRSIA